MRKVSLLLAIVLAMMAAKAFSDDNTDSSISSGPTSKSISKESVDSPSTTKTLAAPTTKDDDEAPVVVTRRTPRYRTEPADVSIIPSIGTNLAEFTGSNTSGFNMVPRVGLAIGSYFEIGSANFVFAPGVFYMQEGSSFTGITTTTTSSDFDFTTTTTGSGEFDFNYITVPLTGKYYFNGQDSASFFLKGGLVPQFLVSNSASVSAGGQSASFNNLSGVQTFDLGIQIGCGGRFPLGNSNTAFLIEGNYTHGVLNVGSSGTLNNSVAGFLTGFGIGI
jgi:hypothetical protein